MKKNLGVTQLLIKTYQQALVYINKVLGSNPNHLEITFNNHLIFHRLK